MRTIHRLLVLSIFLLAGVARAQDINATVAPNIGGSDNFVDIPNTTGGRLHFFTNPSPSAARMAKVSGGTSVAEWPTVGTFAPDPNNSFNRIFPTETLRVYPKTLAAGSTILIEFSYTPVGTRYYYRVLVTAGVQVTSIVTLDPSPTAEVSVRWRVTFDTPVSNVTANNFAFSSGSSGVSGVSITSVVPDTAQPSSSWTVTANTGSYLGLLYLNWAGQRTESPPVANTFTGFPYTFQSAPFFDLNLGPVTINRSSTVTLNVHATMRNGATVYYQWYIGTWFDTNPVAIPGATGTSYTPPVFNTTGTFNYHCIAHATPLNPANSLQKSATAIITVVDPPNITTSPASQTIPYNQTATLSVAATGTALKYQWFQVSGSGPDIPVGIDSPTYTTPALTADAQYYVRVSNAGPTVRTSAVATISVLEPPSLVVTLLGDVVNNRDRQTSLREAVAYAQTLGGQQTVTFAPGLAGQTVTVVNGWNGAGDDTALRIAGNVTIDGGTGVTIQLASPTPRRIFISGGGTFTLRNLTLSGGDIRMVSSGGALWSTGTVNIQNVRFTNNRADHGGAIYNLGTMTISGSSFDNNATAANGQGGAIWSNGTLGISSTLFSLNTAGQLGGAIASFNGLTVTDSTFSGNQSAFNGGALRLDGTAVIAGSTFSNNTAVNGGGALISHGQTTITNSTIAYNTALDGGGAQFFEGTASLRHVTFANNGATRAGGGMAVNSANVTMTNTIVAANSAPDQNNLWGGPLNAASSNNLLNLNAAQAGLGAFAFNGGPTATVALLAGSPAINAGTNIAGITSDQRGVLRPGTGGLRGRYYALSSAPTTALLSPLSNLEALSPTLAVLTPRVDFGGGTEAAAGDGSVLDRSGSSGNLFGGLGVNVASDNIAAIWDGTLTVPTTADYRFTTRSDDGSLLYIDGQLVVNNDFLQGMTNLSGTIALSAGPHTIRMAYFEAGGGAGVQLSWEQLTGTSPFARQIIPPGVLSYRGIAGAAPDIGAFELEATLPAAAPQFSRGSGTYENSVVISLSNPSAGAIIRYTTDGTTPSATNGATYTSSFALTTSATVRAIAVGGGWLDSSVSTAAYTVLTPMPFWRVVHGLAADGSQDLATPAGDGVANVLKFAFNMAPNAGDLLVPNIAPLPENGTAGLPFITRDAQGRLYIEFVRRKAATSPGISYPVETGDDLTALQPLDLGGASVVSIDATWERVTVTDPVITPHRFGRVRVGAFGRYANDFNTGLGAASLRGVAVWDAGAVRLTDAVGGQVGSVVLEGFTASPAVNGFTARFALAMGPTTTAPGDGTSFAAGNLGTGAWDEGGPRTPHSLTVSFDTYDNGGTAGIGIHVLVDGVHVATAPLNPYTNGASVPVEIHYDASLGLTVRYNQALVFDRLAVTGFQFPATARFGFGARTGGANHRSILDNVDISLR